MNTYTALVTIYSGSDKAFKGLTLDEAVLKVQGTIYGYDHETGDIADSIANTTTEHSVTLFCSKYTSQVTVKAEIENV